MASGLLGRTASIVQVIATAGVIAADAAIDDAARLDLDGRDGRRADMPGPVDPDRRDAGGAKVISARSSSWRALPMSRNTIRDLRRSLQTCLGVFPA
jgi:hypothetical protein